MIGTTRARKGNRLKFWYLALSFGRKALSSRCQLGSGREFSPLVMGVHPWNRFVLRYGSSVRRVPHFVGDSAYPGRPWKIEVTALAIVAATAIGFVSTQSAAAQFDTSNSASQTASQTGTATGGNGGPGGVSVGGSANGGPGGSAFVSQGVCQQAAQTGAFGSSSNTISSSDCS
jgi:hypothetical protein